MPGRRPLLPLVALCAITLPACLHIGPVATPITPPEKAAEITARSKAEPIQPVAPRMEFGTFRPLPKAPGAVVQTNPGAPPTVPNTAAHKPPTPAPPANPLRLTGGEPGPFPPITPTAAAEPLLLAAVRAYTEGRPDQAIEIIRKMDKQNQDFVLAVLPILARARPPT